MSYIFILYIVFGIIPSLAWLGYYLRKDVHPEPKRKVLTVFLWGCFITIPVFFVQIGAQTLLDKFAGQIDPQLYAIIYWFLIIALSEEAFKYMVIRARVVNSPELDEPVDVMLYMVISALGFACIENILYLFAPVGSLSFNDLVNRTLVVAFIRFIGSTFLHTLCAAIVGYCLTLGFCYPKKRPAYVFGGLFAATVLHGLFDYSIMTLPGLAKVLVPVSILVILATFIFTGFDKLKNKRGVCKVEI